jgi:hypothetical protein
VLLSQLAIKTIKFYTPFSFITNIARDSA